MKTHHRKRNKPRRGRRSSVTTLIIAATVGLCLLCVTALFILFHPKQQQLLLQQRQTPSGLKDFPGDSSIDLWPHQISSNTRYDTEEEIQLQALMLQNCLPFENAACLERVEDGKTQQIGVLRPPGAFGKVFEDFVLRYIDMSRTPDLEMVVRVSPSVEVVADYSLTKILRPAVVPILLEAIDLVLETLGDDFAARQVTVDDLVGVVRLLIRWHCRLALLSDTTALLTLAFDGVMAYPMQAGKELTEFLGLHHENQENLEMNMDEFAETVFHRIDACTEFLRLLTSSKPGSPRIDDVLKHAVREEIGSGKRCDTRPVRPDEFIAASRVTELVGHFLDGSPETVCPKYPLARLCVQSSGQP